MLTDLYIENSRLVKELTDWDKRHRKLEKENSTLSYKFKAMTKLLSDITNASSA